MSSMSEHFYSTIKDHDKFGEKLYSQLSEDRKKTVESVKLVSNYDDLNIYEMNIYYDYELDNATKPWDKQPDTTQYMQYMINIAIPGSNIPYQAPNYGCSAICCQENKENAIARINNQNSTHVLTKTEQLPHTFMGRNYDFKFDSSAMCVHCHPKNGYKSISFSGLDHIYNNNPLTNKLSRVMTLTSPFIPLDGMNEKGLCVTVLTLDSKPTIHRRGKGILMPGTLIRLLLDRAANTREAIDMLADYDIFSISGRDYHYYITDANGDARAVEYDCNTQDREMVVTKTSTITNFYKMYEDRVKPNQHNGIYGHGKERYDAMNKILKAHNNYGGSKLVWKALKAASQTPSPEEVTSNTQWSAVYNMTTLEVEFCLHRRWSDVFKFSLLN